MINLVNLWKKYLNIIQFLESSFLTTWSAQFLEKLDKYGFVGKILMDLSKTYDSLPHYLLVAKFDA